MKKNVFLVFLSLTVLVSVLCLSPLLDKSANAADVIRLKVANYFPPPANQSKLMDAFCKDLEARTNGRVKVDYFAGGSLLKSTAMFDGVVNGIADIGYSHVYYTAGRMPVTETTGLPLGYPSAWVAGHVMNDFYQKVQPKEFDKVRVLWLNSSTPSAIASKKPIRKLEDLKGLTIRAPGLSGDIMKALGGTPAPTPMMEVYDAISKGVIDGEASNFETLVAFKFAEVVNYSTSIWQITYPFPFYCVMNKKTYDKLPPDIRTIFDELVGEYKERFILMWNSVDFNGKAFGEKKGVEFIDLPPEELAKWQAAVEPVIDGYVKKMAGKGFTEAEVKGWVAFLRERIQYWKDRQVALRIPSIAGPPELKPSAIK